MRISVIIPVYNTKDYLETCVRSALDPAAKEYEILLVDDGSTDGESGALCDALAASSPDRIRVIHQENRGLGGARNTGIREAKGEYLLFLDSDDTLTPGALSFLEKLLSEEAPDVISFGFQTVNEKGEGPVLSTNFREYAEPFALSQHPEFLLSLPNACGRLWRRSLFTDHGIFFPDRVWYEDIRTTTKLFCKAERIRTLPNALYRYLQRSDSIMHSAALNRNREILLAFDDIFSWFRKAGLFETYRDQLCRLLVDHAYLAASVRVLRSDPRHPLLKEISSYLRKEFPDFMKNPYLGDLTLPRKLALHLLNLRLYGLLRLLFRIKNL